MPERLGGAQIRNLPPPPYQTASAELVEQGSMRFDVPIGDSLVIDDDARLFVSDDLASKLIGGPTQWARCRIYLTTRLLAVRFAPEVARCHLALDIPLTNLRAADVRRSWLGVGPARLRVNMLSSERRFDLKFDVASPGRWVKRLNEARPGAPDDPEATLEQALSEGLEDRGRYCRVLQALCFPSLWGGSHEDIEAQIRDAMTRLNAPLPDAFYALARVPDEVIAACEDYDMDEWRAQTSQIADRANELLSPDCPKRFHRFAEDVPGWPDDQPVILFLTEPQRDRLLSLGIVRPRPA